MPLSQPATSPAAERNKAPILEVLHSLLPGQGRALEIASGSGQHAAWFAAGLAGWTWQPSDAQDDLFGSIEAWVQQAGVGNVKRPLLLNVMNQPWLAESEKFDLIYCANMLHISPWATCDALMQGSVRQLAEGGQLVTYGPYLEEGVATSEGNLAFDQSLRSQNPAWGLRSLQAVQRSAQQAGLRLIRRHAMPANNLLLVWVASKHEPRQSTALTA